MSVPDEKNTEKEINDDGTLKDDDNKNKDNDDNSKAIFDKLAEIEAKVEDGKAMSVEDSKIIAALMAGDNLDSKGDISELELKEVDIDSMTNSQLVGHLTKVFEGVTGKQQKELLSRLEESDKKQIKMEVEQEITQARKKYGKDFDDKFEDMLKVANKHPELTADECYLLATGTTSVAKLNVQAEKDMKEEERKKKLLSVSMTPGASSEALLDDLKGKSHKEVALEIAERMNL